MTRPSDGDFPPQRRIARPCRSSRRPLYSEPPPPVRRHPTNAENRSALVMLQPNRAILRQYRQLAVLVSLAFATAVCLGLLALRVTYSHRLVYTYLAWNLFLAWLPMVCALAAYNAGKRRSRLSWLVGAGCGPAWLLLLSNAPHPAHRHPPPPAARRRAAVVRPGAPAGLRLDWLLPGARLAGADAGP